MTDKRQGLIDALNAIQQARQGSKMPNVSPMGDAEVDQEINPDLLQPEVDIQQDQDIDIEINDFQKPIAISREMWYTKLYESLHMEIAIEIERCS